MKKDNHGFKRRWQHMSKRQRTKFIINSILVFLCIICIGVFVYAYPKITRLKNAYEQITIDKVNDPDREDIQNREGFWNILIMGLDSRDDDSVTDMSTSNYGDKRSDCMILVSLNRKTGEVKLLSLYRDTVLQMRNIDFYDTGDYVYSKATHAYSYGSANTLPNDENVDAGPYFTINMVERNLDIQIDNFVSIDFGVVAQVIDALGGVTLTLDDAEVADINQYINEINEITGASSSFIYTPGTYDMDGVQATAYGRVRHTAGDDYKRTFRQRTVLMLTAQKAREASIDTLIKIVELVAPELRTDLTNDEIESLITDYATSFILDEEEGSAGFPFNKATRSGDSYVYPVDTLEENVIQLHEYLYGDTDYSVPPRVVEISEYIENMYNGGSGGYVYPPDDSYSNNSNDNTWHVAPEEPDDNYTYEETDEPYYEEPDIPSVTVTQNPVITDPPVVITDPPVVVTDPPVVVTDPPVVVTEPPVVVTDPPISTEEIDVPL